MSGWEIILTFLAFTLAGIKVQSTPNTPRYYDWVVNVTLTIIAYTIIWVGVAS